VRDVKQSLFPELVADKYIGPLPLSVVVGSNADLVWRFRDVYFAEGTRIVDLTYGTAGGWWRRWRPSTLEVSEHDYTALPYETGSFDTVCFDPPYVATGGKATTDQVDQFRDRFGLDHGHSEQSVLDSIMAGLTEATRITAPTGWCLVKCMDFVGSGSFQDWTYRIHTHATTSLGMALHDEIILNAGTGPGGHNISEPKRARRAHSKLLVFTHR
jgi:hypothetical protein